MKVKVPRGLEAELENEKSLAHQKWQEEGIAQNSSWW